MKMDLSDKELHRLLFDIIEQIGLVSSNDIINENSDLYEEYGLDSVNVIEIALAIEEEFQIEFNLFDLDFSNFQSINSIALMLKNYQ